MAGEKAIKAFMERKVKQEGNTVSTGKTLLLFGNEIAEWRNDKLWITNAGWFSVTTKDRLNKIPLVKSVQQVKGEWFLNGKKWNGEWIEV